MDLSGIQPYMFEPESEEGSDDEEQEPVRQRLELDVSDW